MTRAKPRSVGERRREIIAATIPLLEHEGFTVSTKRIADAAGVAEGTLFRVFSTKEELLTEAWGRYVDAGEAVAAIRAIDHQAPLAEKIERVIAIIQAAASRMHLTMMALHQVHGPQFGQSAPAPSTRSETTEELLGRLADQALAMRDGIAEMLGADPGELADDPQTAATYLFTVSVASQMVSQLMPLSVGAAVGLALRALRPAGSGAAVATPPSGKEAE